jgi:hypothetical protein
MSEKWLRASAMNAVQNSPCSLQSGGKAVAETGAAETEGDGVTAAAAGAGVNAPAGGEEDPSEKCRLAIFSTRINSSKFTGSMQRGINGK